MTKKRGSPLVRSSSLSKEAAGNDRRARSGSVLPLDQNKAADITNFSEAHKDWVDELSKTTTAHDLSTVLNLAGLPDKLTTSKPLMIQQMFEKLGSGKETNTAL